MLQNPAVDLAVEHVAAVPRNALFTKLCKRDLPPVDDGGHARHLLLFLQLLLLTAQDDIDLRLFLLLLKEIGRGDP